jgi:hypothetical protein
LPLTFLICLHLPLYLSPFASRCALPPTYHSLLRFRRILLLFVLSYFYIVILLRAKLFSPSFLFSFYSLPFPSAVVVSLCVSGSMRKPQFVKPTPPALFAVFSLSSGCAAVKAASGRAHVPYHGRRSVSTYVANWIRHAVDSFVTNERGFSVNVIFNLPLIFFTECC